VYTKLNSLVGEDCHSSVRLSVITVYNKQLVSFHGIIVENTKEEILFGVYLIGFRSHPNKRIIRGKVFVWNFTVACRSQWGGKYIVSVLLYSVFLRRRILWTQESVITGVLISP